MRQPVRHATAWAFSALFACISLLGPGWHCWLGHAFHGSACCPDPREGRHAASSCDADAHDAHAGHRHAHHAGAAGQHDPDACGGDSHSGRLSAPHDCPLCSFFAQAQWAEAPALPDGAYLAVSARPGHADSGWIETLRSYRSRAPPSA
jgi:hypothetical protein